MNLKMMFIVMMTGLAVFTSCRDRPVKTELTAGQMVTVTIASTAIGAGSGGENTNRILYVYLPPSYETSDKNYPVVYFLVGFGATSEQMAVLPLMEKRFNKYFTETGNSELIVVVIDGFGRTQGSFYVNSILNGNWEDFIVEETVNYIDGHFRTLALSVSRGIVGHSMGGFGALNIAMKHPDVFSCVYAMSPGIYDSTMQGEEMLEETNLLRVIAVLDGLADNPYTSYDDFIEIISNSMIDNDFDVAFALAYGAAFTPMTEFQPPFIRFPVRLID